MSFDGPPLVHVERRGTSRCQDWVGEFECDPDDIRYYVYDTAAPEYEKSSLERFLATVMCCRYWAMDKPYPWGQPLAWLWYPEQKVKR